MTIEPDHIRAGVDSTAARTDGPVPIRSLKDLAQQAGVSPGTASRALRDSPLISLAVRERIQALANEAGYVPDRRAAALRTKQSRSIGVILVEDDVRMVNKSAAYLMKILKYLLMTIEASGYDVKILYLDDKLLSEDSVAKLKNEIDGAVLIGGMSRDALINKHIPVSRWSAFEDVVDDSSIPGDIRKYLPASCDYMFSLGCRRILLASGRRIFDIIPGRFVDKNEARVDLYELASPSENLDGGFYALEAGDGILVASPDDAKEAISTIRRAGLTEGVDILVAELDVDAKNLNRTSPCSTIIVPNFEYEFTNAVEILLKNISAGRLGCEIIAPKIQAFPQV